MDPAEVGQVVGGCVGQVGMQTMNVTRNAWLAAGLPLEVAATTVDAQCGSSQQATNMAYSLVKSGIVDSAVSCGVELMTKVPMGATIPKDPKVGLPVNQRYWEHYEWTSQFEGAERIAAQWGISAGTPTNSGSAPNGSRPTRGIRTRTAPRSCRSKLRCSTTRASPLTRRSPSGETAAFARPHSTGWPS